MWLIFAFASAALLGCYDICKKRALRHNAVLPVLFFNTLFSSIIFLPLILSSLFGWDLASGTIFEVPTAGWREHAYVIVKACIVLTSWLFGYFAMKHLPITIVGPINATRPCGVLLGALLIFGERLNAYQWVGVILAITAIFLLSFSSRKEGIDFKHNKWILCLLIAAIAAIASGLYDKFIMKHLEPMFVQAWCNFYLAIIMGGVLLALWYPNRATARFHWTWVIVLVPIFLAIADFFYFYSLSLEGSMISIVSMVRRSSVIISFLGGALIFHERNVKNKAAGLLLIMIGMIFLYFGSK